MASSTSSSTHTIPTATINPPTSTVLPDLVAINVTSHLPIKLTPTNYVAWAKQMKSLLIGYGLLGYVNGTNPCPPSTIVLDDKEVENSAFTHWVRQDQLLLLAILGACDIDARAVISQAETSNQAWEQLCTAFANKSRSRVLFLKEKLSSMSKGMSTVSEYLRSIKMVADELNLIGHPLDDIDLVLFCLSGLGPDFKDISTVLRAQPGSLTYDKIFDQLVTHELQLTRENSHPSGPITAHYTQTIF